MITKSDIDQILEQIVELRNQVELLDDDGELQTVEFHFEQLEEELTNLSNDLDE